MADFIGIGPGSPLGYDGIGPMATERPPSEPLLTEDDLPLLDETDQPLMTEGS